MEGTQCMKIAIHHWPGSFSDRWIAYCIEKGIHYELVNCYDSSIVERLQACDVLLWHWHQNDTKAILFARQLIASLQKTNITVFPNINTCWHFDDKVGQKYLLESIGAPLVPSYVFYDEESALQWIEQAAFPKVFKLRVGAGSRNVRLVRSRTEARALCRQAFRRGFPAVPGYWTDMRTRLRKTKTSTEFWDRLRRAPKTVWRNHILRHRMPCERGYLYFQDFVSGNEWDTRVTVIGSRAFAFRRMVRRNDFRASGSGRIDYSVAAIDTRCVHIAFQVTRGLALQSMAFDFVMDQDVTPQIVEMSYCYVPEAVQACPGHWDKDLIWHEGEMWPQDAILEDVLAQIGSGSAPGQHEILTVSSLQGNPTQEGWQGL